MLFHRVGGGRPEIARPGSRQINHEICWRLLSRIFTARYHLLVDHRPGGLLSEIELWSVSTRQHVRATQLRAAASHQEDVHEKIVALNQLHPIQISQNSLSFLDREGGLPLPNFYFRIEITLFYVQCTRSSKSSISVARFSFWIDAVERQIPYTFGIQSKQVRSRTQQIITKKSVSEWLKVNNFK